MAFRSPQRRLTITALLALVSSCSSGISGKRADGSAPQSDSRPGVDGTAIADDTAIADGPSAADGRTVEDLAASEVDTRSSGDGGVALSAEAGEEVLPDGGGAKPDTEDAGGIRSCPVLKNGPPGTGPLPSAAQLAYQRLELTALLNLDMATYSGSEAESLDPPSFFNPTNLDENVAAEWAHALKAAGFRQAMLVAKDLVGFCLWPTATTDYSISKSPWKDGKGDIVRLFVDAMHAVGLRVAFAISPWDMSHPSDKADYETYFKNQLTELLTGYGPVAEISFDGFHAPITNVDWNSVVRHIKQLQPEALVYAGPEIVDTGAPVDVQWITTESGAASRLTSSLTIPKTGGQSAWRPYECNVSVYRPNWSWHPNSRTMTLADVQKVYYSTVGMNGTLLFGVPPTATGEFDPQELNLLQQFGSWTSSLYEKNLAKEQPATADSTWAAAGFEAAKAVDDDICTYWAAQGGKTSARLEVTTRSPNLVSLISIREAIELGERVQKYHIELKQDGAWRTAPNDKAGAIIKGTVIGQRQLWQLAPTTAEAVALVIDVAKDAPAIAELSVY